MASCDVALLHLRKALSILDADSHDVAACHVQLAIDLILEPNSGYFGRRYTTADAAATTA